MGWLSDGHFDSPSLSARRAWIEISFPQFPLGWAFVALRKESVDRNYRRFGAIQHTEVALRKESVDRNGQVVSSEL